MTTTVELSGNYQVGDRCWIDGQPHRVTRVIDRRYWTADRIEDEDEFGRQPGWYSDVETEPDQLTAEEAARIAAEEAEKTARREKVNAEWREYRAKLSSLREEHARLIHGLDPAQSLNHSVLDGLTREELGIVCEPGKGCDGTTELVSYRDANGVVKAVSFGCPYDMGPGFWIAADLAERSTDKKRIWKWWNPTGYHVDSYPGPGVPLDELTADERSEVDRLETARLVEIRKKQVRSLEISARTAMIGAGLVEPTETEKWLTKPKSCPVRARSFALEFGPEFEQSLLDYAAYDRARTGTHPSFAGLTIRVVLGPEAYTKKGRKPAPIDALPKSLTLHNFATASIVYVRGDA